MCRSHPESRPRTQWTGPVSLWKAKWVGIWAIKSDVHAGQMIPMMPPIDLGQAMALSSGDRNLVLVVLAVASAGTVYVLSTEKRGSCGVVPGLAIRTSNLHRSQITEMKAGAARRSFKRRFQSAQTGYTETKQPLLAGYVLQH